MNSVERHGFQYSEFPNLRTIRILFMWPFFRKLLQKFRHLTSLCSRKDSYVKDLFPQLWDTPWYRPGGIVCMKENNMNY